MMKSSEITAQLKDRARSLGFNMAGILPAAPGRRLDAYMRWISEGRHGQMGYMARPDRIERRQDLNVILPGVRSIVSVGLDYYSDPIPARINGDPSRGRISNYAWGKDYHEVMTPRLKTLAGWLADTAGGPVTSKVYVDTGAILERDHGEQAGLGFIGKNSMLIHPRRGSWFFLGELLTTLPLGYDEMTGLNPSCGRCRRCLDACPTAAFPAPYVLDARRCISYLTIELKGWIPHQLRPLMGNWIYGCDVCQEVCPFNRFAQTGDESAWRPADWDRAAPPLVDLLALDEAGFQAWFGRSPIKRIRHRGLVRNACVAAGNWGHEAAVPPLVRLLSDPEPLIRGHAAWALRQIGGQEAERSLAVALNQESEERVRQEMAAT